MGTVLSEPLTTSQQRDLENRIIGGTAPSQKRFPYYTYVMIGTGYGKSSACGGSLIAADVVLTAAHCLESDAYFGGSVLGVDVYVNSTTAKYSEYEYFRAGIDWVVHPDRDPEKLSNDIALIFLDTPVTGVPLVKINRDASIPVDVNPSALTAIGRGADIANSADIDFFFPDYTFPDQLMQVAIYPVPIAPCRRTHGSYYVGESNLCAGSGGDELKGACYGDSGGPVVMKKSSAQKDVQVGIVSWGSAGCSDADKPEVLTRVSYFAGWIDEQICMKSNNKPSACPTAYSSYYKEASKPPTKKPSIRPTTGKP